MKLTDKQIKQIEELLDCKFYGQREDMVEFVHSCIDSDEVGFNPMDDCSGLTFFYENGKGSVSFFTATDSTFNQLAKILGNK